MYSGFAVMGYLVLISIFMVLGLCITRIPRWRVLKNNRLWWFAYGVSCFTVTNYVVLIVWLTFLTDNISKNRAVLVLGFPAIVFTILAVSLWRRFNIQQMLEGNNDGK